MSDVVKIIGLAETKKALAELPAKMEKSVLRRGLRQGANVVLAAARTEAPKLTGATAKNAKVRAGKGGPGKIAFNIGVNAKDFKGDQFYASFILYGWKHGSRKLGDKRKSIAANNWLARAYDETKDAAIDVTSKSWAEQIEAMK